MEEKKSHLTMLLIIVIIALGGLLIKSLYFDKLTLITVTGTGTVNIAPTKVQMTVTFANSDKSATNALAANGQLAKNLMNVAKANSVADKDIVISYSRVVGSSTGEGAFQAVNTLDLTLNSLANFDKLVSSLYAGGAYSVSNIIFTTENSKDLEKQAVNLAIDDAKVRANEVAKKLGKRVVRVNSIATQEVGEAGALSGTASSGSQFGGGELSTSPTKIDIIRQASIVFELR
ncbi:MAG: SIMPL domain-containing protein [Candidatus Gottesmanbacteria bacterium]